MQFCRLSQNRVLKVDFCTHFRDKNGHLFLWVLELFWPSLKVGQTKVENMHICQLFQNWVLKVDLGTHLRDNHGHLFLSDLELFFPSFKFGQTKVENMHFCWLSRNWVLSWFRYQFEIYAWTPIFIIFGVILALIQVW